MDPRRAKTANTLPGLKERGDENDGRLWAITFRCEHRICESCFREVVMQRCEAIEIIWRAQPHWQDTDAFMLCVFFPYLHSHLARPQTW